MYECNDTMVSHPSHYQSKTGLEVIDIIEAFTDDLTGIEATDTGNVLKYMCRWKSKNGLQDLKKAQWYLTHLIEHMEKKTENRRSKTIYDCDTCVNQNKEHGGCKHANVCIVDERDFNTKPSHYVEKESN